MTNDCRTDNLLIGFSCFAIWKIASAIQSDNRFDLYTGFTGIGFAMLAKGPLGLVFPFFTIACLFIKRKNNYRLNWNWFWGLPIVLVILTPMCIGFYQQYGFKGLEFYFWTQSFGRITGQSEWINDSGPFYLVHTFLWCFIPFTLVFILALLRLINKMIIRHSEHPIAEYGTVGGMVLTFISLAFSSYKLPHYIYIICPFAADAGRYCTWLNVRSTEEQSIIAGLKDGRGFGMKIPSIKQEQGQSRLLRIRNQKPLFEKLFFSNDTLQVELSELAVKISFIGLEGVIRTSMVDTSKASYEVKPEDTYIRIQAEFRDGTEIYLNPVFRYTKTPMENFRASTVLKLKSYFFYIMGLILLIIWIVLFEKFIQGDLRLSYQGLH